MNKSKKNFAVIKNVCRSFEIDSNNLSFIEARDRCSAIIAASCGGECYVVSNETAKFVEGKECVTTYFEWYSYDGKPLRWEEE